MKLFIKEILSFCLIFLCIILIGIFAPVTSNVSKSLIFAQIDKDSLLLNTPSKRVILIGGSNLSFGINSAMLKDSLTLNPVNTAIHASIGLKYMLNHSEKYIKSGDIVIISPEYSQYFGDNFYGGDELLRTIFDVSKNDCKLISFKQWIHLSPYIFTYACSKFNITSYLIKGRVKTDVYLRSSFNKFGDVDTRLIQKAEKNISPFPTLGGEINNEAIKELLTFRDKINKKGADMYITYPGYQAKSFQNSFKQINIIQDLLIKNGFKILGNPYRYEFQDSLLFNTPYHLNKQGVDTRTKLLIQDLKPFLLKRNLAINH